VVDLSGQVAAGQDQLFAAVQQGVQGVAQFRLELFLAAEKLHLLHQEHLTLPPVALLEAVHLVPFQGLYHVVGKIFGGHIKNRSLGQGGQQAVPHRLGEVAFPQAGIGSKKQDAVEKGVGAGQGFSGAVGQPVGAPHHEFFEGELPVQTPAPTPSLARQGQAQLVGHERRRGRARLTGRRQQLNGQHMACMGQNLLNMGKIMGSDPSEGERVGTDELKLLPGGLIYLQGFDP
jgi:hypothetical protein